MNSLFLFGKKILLMVCIIHLDTKNDTRIREYFLGFFLYYKWWIVTIDTSSMSLRYIKIANLTKQNNASTACKCQ